MKALKWFIIFLVLVSIGMLFGMAYLLRTFSDYAAEELRETSPGDTQLPAPQE